VAVVVLHLESVMPRTRGDENVDGRGTCHG
jgi:hypothetical protein